MRPIDEWIRPPVRLRLVAPGASAIMILSFEGRFTSRIPGPSGASCVPPNPPGISAIPVSGNGNQGDSSSLHPLSSQTALLHALEIHMWKHLYPNANESDEHWSPFHMLYH